MGGPIDLENEDDDSPLSLAIDSENKEAVEVLVKAGAALDVGAGTNGGITHYAVREHDSELLCLALEMSAPVESVDQDGQTAVFKSVVGFPATEKVFYRLLEEGAKLDVFDWKGDSPLFHAVSTGNQDLIQFLVNFGATIGLVNARGESALTKALESGNGAMTAWLLQWNAEDAGL